MKKFLAIMLVAFLALGITGCGSSGTKEESTFEIALVTDVGNIDDHSFNQATWEAVEQYAKDNNKTYAYYRPSEDSNEARIEQIKNAIDKGAKVVVCPGYLFETAIYDVQTTYPEVMFLLLDGEPHTADYATYKTESNVHNILYQEEQAGYFAGYAAVKDGYTKLGFCGGINVPAVIRYGYGYVQGADAAAKEMGIQIEIKYTYAGAFAPSDDLLNKMNSWYSSGTEIVFACGGSLYQSVFKAAETNNAKSIGVDVDQSKDSETVVTSAMKQLKITTIAALTALYDNNLAWPEDYAGKTATLGAKDDATGLPTDTDSWRFKTFTVDEYKAVFDKVVDGSIKISNATDVAPTTTNSTVDYNA